MPPTLQLEDDTRRRRRQINSKEIGDNTEPCLTPTRTANISEYMHSILCKKNSYLASIPKGLGE